MSENIIYSKSYKTSTGQDRLVEVREDGWGFYRVIKWHKPKKKNSISYGTYDSGYNFASKEKAIKKAKSLMKKKRRNK